MFEQMPRGDHSSSNILRTRRHGMNKVFRSSLISQVFSEIEGRQCRWHVLWAKTGFVTEHTSCMTNHPDLTEALETWCESVSGVELDRHNMKIVWQRTSFVDDVRGGVLDPERVKQARQGKVKWCRVMFVWELVLRKDMEAEGAEAVSQLWIDTDKVMRVDQTTALDWL